jgi:hypothetical protein
MFKLKLSIWTREYISTVHVKNSYLGIAFDHKSFAAIEEAIRAGCFGPQSKTAYYTEYTDPSYGNAVTPLFEKKKGRLVSVLPFVVADNWLAIAKKSAEQEDVINMSGRRRKLATKWDLVPFDFVDLLPAKK